MKLYSSWSPNPQKVLFGAAELGLSPEIVEIDLFQGEQRTEAFRKLNPMQKVRSLKVRPAGRLPSASASLPRRW
jgi:glutathione S-transferase